MREKKGESQNKEKSQCEGGVGAGKRGVKRFFFWGGDVGRGRKDEGANTDF